MPPNGENGIEFKKGIIEKVLRYSDDWITVSNGNDELTYLRNDPDMIEWVES